MHSILRFRRRQLREQDYVALRCPELQARLCGIKGATGKADRLKTGDGRVCRFLDSCR